MIYNQERFDIFSMTPDQIRTKILDPYRSNLNMIARDHPEIIEQFEKQYESDQQTYGRIPTFISVNTVSGIVNTTIRYKDFIRFLALFKQRPDLVGTNLGDNIINRKQIPLQKQSVYATELLGEPNIPGFKR